VFSETISLYVVVAAVVAVVVSVMPVQKSIWRFGFRLAWLGSKLNKQKYSLTLIARQT
jgi:hypothetical protein